LGSHSRIEKLMGGVDAAYFSITRQDVKTAVGQAFQPDSKPGNIRLESLTYLIFWRVVDISRGGLRTLG